MKSVHQLPNSPGLMCTDMAPALRISHSYILTEMHRHGTHFFCTTIVFGKVGNQVGLRHWSGGEEAVLGVSAWFGFWSVCLSFTGVASLQCHWIDVGLLDVASWFESVRRRTSGQYLRVSLFLWLSGNAALRTLWDPVMNQQYPLQIWVRFSDTEPWRGQPTNFSEIWHLYLELT